MPTIGAFFKALFTSELSKEVFSEGVIETAKGWMRQKGEDIKKEGQKRREREREFRPQVFSLLMKMYKEECERIQNAKGTVVAPEDDPSPSDYPASKLLYHYTWLQRKIQAGEIDPAAEDRYVDLLCIVAEEVHARLQDEAGGRTVETEAFQNALREKFSQLVNAFERTGTWEPKYVRYGYEFVHANEGIMWARQLMYYLTPQRDYENEMEMALAAAKQAVDGQPEKATGWLSAVNDRLEENRQRIREDLQ